MLNIRPENSEAFSSGPSTIIKSQSIESIHIGKFARCLQLAFWFNDLGFGYFTESVIELEKCLDQLLLCSKYTVKPFLLICNYTHPQ